MAATKKTATRKKAAKKTAKKTTSKTTSKTTKKTAAGKAPAPATAKTPDTGAASKSALEERLLGPLADLEKLVGQFRRLPIGNLDFSKFAGRPSFLEERAEASFPKIDIVNREKEIVVRAEVPGIDKEDIEISLTDQTLSIKGQSRHEEETEEGDVHRHEIRTGAFSRVVTLPEEVDGRKAKSSYKDGVVELRLPKSRKAKKHSITLD